MAKRQGAANCDKNGDCPQHRRAMPLQSGPTARVSCFNQFYQLLKVFPFFVATRFYLGVVSCTIVNERHRLQVTRSNDLINEHLHSRMKSNRMKFEYKIVVMATETACTAEVN